MVERKMSVGEKIRRGIVTATYAAGMLSARSPQISAVCLNESEAPQCNNGEVRGGYWWRNEVWVPSYPSIDTRFRSAPDWSIGGAVFYNDGIMEANAEYRVYLWKDTKEEWL